MKKHNLRPLSHKTLSVVLATRNEEQNIGECLESIKYIADEIIIFDEESSDKTPEIAKKYGAKVFTVKHEPIFHITKQKALSAASGNWILQLDADERVTPKLGEEIKEVVKFENNQIVRDQFERKCNEKNELYELFLRHQKLIEKREGHIGTESGEIVAFFIPRRNFFLGKQLVHAGVYPDGVIRLVKFGKAKFPAKSVHELMEVDGEVAWLFNDLEHHESPTFSRYLERLNRYTDLQAKEFKIKFKSKRSIIHLLYFSFIKPFYLFLLLYLRHKGYLDGMRGFIWSVFSALRYPIAYFKYWQSVKS
ncbi:MAG: Glycosyltransferase [Candidatus Woesebacteria bacterium GW2011_GWA1_37_7]|uniref:Glycosyltransferase n=2 Tax=Candidatus Woeseibacteriota TaxID=1752722 RepID=A0A0G0H4G5_9BACT|nr:MAG: Glycosyltransferase [Candidatus Woesebacteria bacterium GW2011_GWA1_37_7]OGM19698.1 MAG: hypothetical protein A2685_01100 [Candidatus Woesebacteria bacterium RIFCSPHIGHO2_01_FULL_37_10]